MSKDDLSAEDIFNTFQSRREVLARTGKLAAAGALPAVLAACAVEPNPTVTGPEGETLIQVTDGLNCFDGGCLRLDLARREVSALGREPVAVPGDIAVEGGTVTPEDFTRLRSVARAAPRKRAGGNGGSSSDAGGGSGNDCNGCNDD